ncbi:hypothetical protein EJ04DRAFT_548281 [Polyplosphaeria fusca]|uniref:N-acetyltransferase domain-containing protein n=1 Tax=Polyplosphaeria fusca TaxID=682080 RepID=A0A9P4RB66_9PLEO|nr:hypothetical protein EJ04DRAFT_548281 [Polyplosphaeria fusca]
MPFQLSEVTSVSDFDLIMPVLFRSFHQPYNTLSKFFNPIHTTPEAAIEASKERQISLWKSNPACHWLKVTETDSAQIVGAASWFVNVAVKPPSAEKKPFQAKWHIEGSDEKAFAEKLIGGLIEFGAARMTRPHLELGQLVVDPDHRLQGIGGMLLQWGVAKADELELETVVKSVPFAVPMYKRRGFGAVEQIDIDFSVPEPSEKWKDYQSEDLRVFFMWKPSGRDYQEGEPLPWKN